MVNKWSLAVLNLIYKQSLCLSKCKLTQAGWVRSMAIWDSVPVKNFIVPVLHIQIGLGNYFLKNLLDYIDSDVQKLSTGEEVARNTLVTVNQVITNRRKECQIWDFNDGIML